MADWRKAKIGILALQGAVEPHEYFLSQLQIGHKRVQFQRDLSTCDALILPGGESTTISKLLVIQELVEPCIQFAKSKPIWGICAGAILLARTVPCDPPACSFSLIDMTMERNGYGAQVHSFVAPIDVNRTSFQNKEREGVFIRAPRIYHCNPSVNIVATLLRQEKAEPVAVKQGAHLATTFHPELSSSPTLYSFFLRYLLQG